MLRTPRDVLKNRQIWRGANQISNHWCETLSKSCTLLLKVIWRWVYPENSESESTIIRRRFRFSPVVDVAELLLNTQLLKICNGACRFCFALKNGMWEKAATCWWTWLSTSGTASVLVDVDGIGVWAQADAEDGTWCPLTICDSCLLSSSVTSS